MTQCQVHHFGNNCILVALVICVFSACVVELSSLGFADPCLKHTSRARCDGLATRLIPSCARMSSVWRSESAVMQATTMRDAGLLPYCRCLAVAVVLLSVACELSCHGGIQACVVRCRGCRRFVVLFCVFHNGTRNVKWCATVRTHFVRKICVWLPHPKQHPKRAPCWNRKMQFRAGRLTCCAFRDCCFPTSCVSMGSAPASARSVVW